VISNLPPELASVIHVHCQYSYFDGLQQGNIKRCLSRADFGITPARFLTTQLARCFPDVEWRTVYNGIDTRRFRPSTSEERRLWRREHGIPEHCLLIGFVGRLERAKGLEILEEFVRLSANTRLHLLLQFLAHSTRPAVCAYHATATRVQQSAPGRVSLFPDTDLSTDRPVRYFDVLFTPSLSEVCPLVVLEAFHSGVPVLATRATPFYTELQDFSLPSDCLHLVDLPDLSAQSRSDLSVPADAASSVAQRLVTIAASLQPPDDDYRARLSGSTGEAGFTQQQMLTSFNHIYSEAIERHLTVRCS
jgi:glycosyltransferase involved in cell wall biosynthesis